MAEKSTVHFMGRYTCHFVHRQDRDQPLVVKASDKQRVWFEYSKDQDPKQRKSCLCVYHVTTINTSFFEELRKAGQGELAVEGVEFTFDVAKQRGQRLTFPSGLTKGCEDRLSQISSEIQLCADNVITNFRWRLDLAGPGKAFANRDFLWSVDGNSWLEVPHIMFMNPYVRRDIVVEKLSKEVVAIALQPQRNEPIAHSLFRDAWNHRWQDNKSALTQGVSALEVGVKHCIIKLVPEVEYLILKMPTPPVVNLLRDFLPGLVAKKSIAVPALDVPTLKSVQNMVHQRNLLVHKGELTVNVDKVTEYLEIIHDILYYLDFVAGNVWALGLTSVDFKNWLTSEMSGLDLMDPLANRDK